jgi:transposase
VRYEVPYRLKDLERVKDLSREAQVRLKFLEVSKGHPVTVTCRRFGISRATYYRWKARYDTKRLGSLENRSKRPKNVRKPKWTWQLAEKVKELRERHPAWGKAKLHVLLLREGTEVSESTVGRILRYLKRRGAMVEPVRKVRASGSARRRVYAVRKPKDYEVRAPGDVVQIDTPDVRPDPGKVYKQFSAVDVVSK